MTNCDLIQPIASPTTTEPTTRSPMTEPTTAAPTTVDPTTAAFSPLDPMVGWLLLSIFMAFGVLLIVSGYICIVMIRKRHKKESMKSQMELATYMRNVPSNTYNTNGQIFTNDIAQDTTADEITDENENEQLEFQMNIMMNMILIETREQQEKQPVFLISR